MSERDTDRDALMMIAVFDAISSGRQTMNSKIAGSVREVIASLRAALAAEKEAREKAERRFAAALEVIEASQDEMVLNDIGDEEPTEAAQMSRHFLAALGDD